MSTLYALQHRVCGHIAGVGARDLLSHQLVYLHEGGYHQWRLRVAPTDDDLAALLACTRCDLCRFDHPANPVQETT